VQLFLAAFFRWWFVHHDQALLVLGAVCPFFRTQVIIARVRVLCADGYVLVDVFVVDLLPQLKINRRGDPGLLHVRLELVVFREVLGLTGGWRLVHRLVYLMEKG